MKKKYWIIAALLLLWLIVFCSFVYHISQESRCHYDHYSNMAILTGEKNRIPDAIFFLGNSLRPEPANVLISGVNHHATIRDLLGDQTFNDINFTLGKHAKNTRGNAKEIIDWMKDNNMQEVTIITSDYHMPRSILEIKHLDPHIKIGRYYVISKRDWRFFLYCFKEFHKIILAHIRHFFENLVHGND